jgi:hypothetical protein
MIVGLNTLWYVGLQPFFFLSYYLLEFDEFFFQETYICRIDTETILQPSWISIQICGWRQDCLVDSLEIRCTDSLILRPRTYGRPVVFRPLDVRNRS